MTSVATSKLPGNLGMLLVTAGSTDGIGLPAKHETRDSNPNKSPHLARPSRERR